MQTGDLVRWRDHEKWDRAGLGTIVEIKHDGALGWMCKIMWHIDIEDIVDYKGVWYDTLDFHNDCIVKV